MDIYLLFDRETECNDLNRLLHLIKKPNYSRSPKDSFLIKQDKRTFDMMLVKTLHLPNISKENVKLHLMFLDEYNKLLSKGKVVGENVFEYIDRDFMDDNDVYKFVIQQLITTSFHIARLFRQGNEIKVIKGTSNDFDLLSGFLSNPNNGYVSSIDDKELNTKIGYKLSMMYDVFCASNEELEKRISDNRKTQDNINQMLSEL